MSRLIDADALNAFISDLEYDIKMDKDSLDMVNFYFDIIVPEYVARPNTFYMSGSKIQEKYPSVYNKYKQDGNRLVIQPNINHDAPYMIKVGKLSDGVIIND